jgi:hypothetical protein
MFQVNEYNKHGDHVTHNSGPPLFHTSTYKHEYSIMKYGTCDVMFIASSPNLTFISFSLLNRVGTQLLSLKLPHQIYSIEASPFLQNGKERWKRGTQKGYNCLAETRILYTLISFIFRIIYKCFQRIIMWNGFHA